MPVHLQRDIEEIKKKIIALSTLVEENVARAVKSADSRDASLAAQAIELDADIDKQEIVVEDACLKTLALNQPVAADLRFIVAVLKINNDLERIGDMAVNIAERAQELCRQDKPETAFFDWHAMVEKVRLMLKKSLDSLISLDPALAQSVCASDDEIDAMNRDMFTKTIAALKTRPDSAEYLIHLLSISRHLERIADHATNIAEDVLYMTEGYIVRHGGMRYTSLVEGRKKAEEQSFRH
jgi:phosphate transport system protein